MSAVLPDCVIISPYKPALSSVHIKDDWDHSQNLLMDDQNSSEFSGISISHSFICKAPIHNQSHLMTLFTSFTSEPRSLI